MKAIFKYKLVLNGNPQTVMMPEGAAILSVQFQGSNGIVGDICVWAMVDASQLQLPHVFYVFGTGQPLPDIFDVWTLKNRHLGTVQQGPFVWHVFGGAVESQA